MIDAKFILIHINRDGTRRFWLRAVELTSLLPLKRPWPPVAISREGLHQHQAWLLEAWFFGKQNLDTQIPTETSNIIVFFFKYQYIIKYHQISSNIINYHHIYHQIYHQISIDWEKKHTQRKAETDWNRWPLNCKFHCQTFARGKASPQPERTRRWFFMTWHKNRPGVRLDASTDSTSWISIKVGYTNIFMKLAQCDDFYTILLDITIYVSLNIYENIINSHLTVLIIIEHILTIMNYHHHHHHHQQPSPRIIENARSGPRTLLASTAQRRQWRFLALTLFFLWRLFTMRAQNIQKLWF